MHWEAVERSVGPRKSELHRQQRAGVSRGGDRVGSASNPAVGNVGSQIGGQAVSSISRTACRDHADRLSKLLLDR